MGCLKISYYADVVSYSNYLAFNSVSSFGGGMLLLGRHPSVDEQVGNADTYNRGFNGMLKDDEIKNVEGSSYDFGARMYDSRIGRFLSVDPKCSKYPYLSTYCFASNNPIYLVDENGEGPIAFAIHLITMGKILWAKKTDKIVKTKVSASFWAGIPSLGVGGNGEMGMAVDKYGNIGFYMSGRVFADASLTGDDHYAGQSAGTTGAHATAAGVTITAGISISGKKDVTQLAGKGSGGIGIALAEQKLNIKGGWGIAGGVDIETDEFGVNLGLGAGFGFSNVNSSTFVIATTYSDLKQLEDNYGKIKNLYLEKGAIITTNTSEKDGWTTVSAKATYLNKKGEIVNKTYNLVTFKSDSKKNLIMTKHVKLSKK